MRRLITLGFFVGSLSAYAAPGIMNYQAKLTDSGGNPIISPDGRFLLFASTANNLALSSSNTPCVTLVPARMNVAAKQNKRALRIDPYRPFSDSAL